MKATKKATKAVAQKSAKSVKAVKTVKALTLTLDIKQNHSMRVAAAQKGADLFATHSQDQTSRGYIEQLFGVNRDELFKTVQNGEIRILIVNGVSNMVRVDKEGVFYGRNGKLAVRDFDSKQMLHGNVDSLRALYGDKVALLTEEQARSLYDAQKEQVTRKVGSGKAKLLVTGRVIAKGSKGDMALSVVAVENNGKLVFHNCEDKNNAHNWLHRFSQESATVTK